MRLALLSCLLSLSLLLATVCSACTTYEYPTLTDSNHTIYWVDMCYNVAQYECNTTAAADNYCKTVLAGTAVNYSLIEGYSYAVTFVGNSQHTGGPVCEVPASCRGFRTITCCSESTNDSNNKSVDDDHARPSPPAALVAKQLKYSPPSSCATFTLPTVLVNSTLYWFDWCYGQPHEPLTTCNTTAAALSYCTMNGYQQLVDMQVSFPAYMMACTYVGMAPGYGQVCPGPTCGGFQYIQCC